MGDHDDDPQRMQERAAFSEFLLRARSAAHLSLDEIATMTKVPARHLDALEQGRIAELPRGVYRRSILRTYASAVGLDPSLVLARFSQAYGTDAAFSEWEVPRVQPRVPAAAPPPRTASATAAVRPPLAAARPAAATPRSTAAPAPRADSRWRVAAGAAILLLVLLAAYSFTRPNTSQPDAASPTPADAAPPQLPPASPAAAATVPVSDGTANPGAAPRVGESVASDESAAQTAEVVPDPLTDAQLVVTSNPPGARVTVDGIGWGVTPITIRHLSPGVKRVRITLDGYVAEERDIRVGSEGGTVTAAATLQPRN